MHIEYLEEFTELAQCLNFTEAARRCNITQPALSKHLMALEKEMGTQLVLRNRHNVELSQAGHALLHEALPFCEQYRSMRERVRAMATMPTLRIGGLIQNPHVLWILSSALSSNNDGQSLSCSYSQDLSRPFLEMLESGDIDLAFTYQDGDQSKANEGHFERIDLFEDRFVAVMQDRHPLAKFETLEMKDLRDSELVRLSGPYYSLGWERISAVCESHGFKPKCRSAAFQPGLDYSLVDLHDGILILSQSSLTGQLFARAQMYRCIPIVDDNAHFSICALYRSDDDNRALSILAERLKSQHGQ